MVTYHIFTEDGTEHVTGDPGQALHAIERSGQACKVKVRTDMTALDYDRLPATSASFEFFKLS